MGQGDGGSGSTTQAWRPYDLTLRIGHAYVAAASFTALVLAVANWGKGTVHAAAPSLRASAAIQLAVPPPAGAPLLLPPPPLPLPPLPPLLLVSAEARSAATPGSVATSAAPSVAADNAPGERAATLPGGALEQLDTPLGPVELVWEQPAEAPVGVVTLFHGCSHSAGDFFAPTSPRCTSCLGLPEERRIQEAALRARLLTVAFSSSDRGRRCWAPASDGPRVAAALAALLRRQRAEALPLYALGASSGGAFAAALPFYVPHIAALEAQIMGADPEQLLAPLPPGHGLYPPSRWTHMPRDAQMAEFVQSAIAALRETGLEVEESRIEPRAITPSFFSERVAGITPAASAGIEAALRGAKLLDADGFLLQDPRAGGGAAWRAALAPLSLGDDKLVADASPIAEELNVAWASHEITADDLNATLAFFARHAAPRPMPSVQPDEAEAEEEEEEEADEELLLLDEDEPLLDDWDPEEADDWDELQAMEDGDGAEEF